MILTRMLLRLQVKSVLTALAVLAALLLVVDFLDSARHLFGPKVSLVDVLLLYAFKLPGVLHMMLPVALVVGTATAFALLGRHQELRALAAAGVGPARLLVPVAIVAAGTVAATVLIGELGVPPAANAMERLMGERFGRIDSSWRFFRSHLWVQGDQQRLIRVGNKSDDGRTLEHVIVLEVGDDFLVQRRLDARTVRRKAGTWVGERVVERRFEGGRLSSYHKEAMRTLPWTEKPDRFRNLSGRPQQKTMAGLAEVARELERRGIGADEYRLSIHQRVANPLVGLLLVLLSLPWAIQPARRRSLSAALLESTGLIFIGYLLIGLSTSAVSGGLLAPWAGAWVPLGILLLAGAPRWLAEVRRARLGGALGE